MSDQAAVLRNMARRLPRRVAAPRKGPPRVWALAGPPSAGVTHVALRMAIGLAGQGSQVLVVEADILQDSRRAAPYALATLCNSNDGPGVHDVLLARCELSEIVRRGPGGVWIAPCAPAGATAGAAAFSRSSQVRLLREVKSLGDLAEVVLIDTGRLGEGTRFWVESADEIAIVCTPAPAQITAAYACIKRLAAGDLPATLHLAVNGAESLEQGLDTWRRVRTTSERFLGLPVEWLGGLPFVASAAEELDDPQAVARQPEVEAISLRVLGLKNQLDQLEPSANGFAPFTACPGK